MIIKKIKLKNIRSYTDGEIKFPEGVILLSGDIGAGKSTVLLAIEFCLFGIVRGELSGSSLLRNGCNDGFVHLTFFLFDREISIKRTLKKTSNGIVQDAGFLTINDVTQQLTPVELKQNILDILNYPQEALTKKSLIFRYTVYTPQEEMKIILLGNKEDRLQTLRKVFGIDRYKKIKDNANIITAEIKQKKRELEGFVSDLEPKKARVIELQALSNNIHSHKTKTADELAILNMELVKKTEEHKKLEEYSIKIIHLKKDLENILNNKALKHEHKNRISVQLKIIQEQLNKIDAREYGTDIEELRKTIKESESSAESTEKELSEISRKLAEINTKKNASDEIKESIKRLDTCPLCRQNVSEKHKHDVSSSEDSKISHFEKDIKIFTDAAAELTKKIKDTKEALNKHKIKEKDYELNILKLKDARSKIEIIENIKNEIADADKSLNEIAKSEEEIKKSLELMKNTGEEIIKSKEIIDSFTLKQKKYEIEIASSEREINSLKKQIESATDEIKTKEKAAEKIDYYINLLHWIDDHFVNIVDIIEKKVMLNVHAEFDSRLQKWFEMLVDADTIKVRLDEEFTPLIEQNNHDLEYENLSGGEKTACALAYRLALNHVINDIASLLNTKDIIILDEPTDGFSSEQLEKIRGVFEELKMRQIIIVSHEPKIEMSADKIIRIEKHGHTSRVSA